MNPVEYKTTFYIGGDNKRFLGDFTPNMEIKLTDYLDKHFDSYTILKGNASYKGEWEQCRVVIIFTPEPVNITSIVKDLCKLLKQEVILVEADDGNCLIDAKGNFV
jgi:hypothetical protein